MTIEEFKKLKAHNETYVGSVNFLNQSGNIIASFITRKGVRFAREKMIEVMQSGKEDWRASFGKVDNRKSLADFLNSETN